MVAPLAWIFPRVEWWKVAGRAFDLGLVGFVLGASLLALSVVVNGLRWHALLRAHDAAPLPRRRTLVWHAFVALYLNQLPGGVAGDVVRAHRVRESVEGTATSLAVLAFERVCGLVALLAMATIGALAIPTKESSRIDTYLEISAFVTGAIAIFVVGLPWLSSRIRWESTRFAKLPLVGSIARLRPPRRLLPLATAVALSFVIHSLTVTVIAGIVHTLVPAAPVALVVAITPLAMLLTFVPLTPAGFGQREAIFIELFGLAGVAPADAVAASLLWFSAASASLAIGLLLSATERVRGERVPRERESD